MSALEQQTPIQEELKVVDVNQISVNPYQPRRFFQKEELEDLASSIKSVGLLHPPLVRSIPNTDQYELISGERRYRAAQLAGMQMIPVLVRHTSYSISAQAALIENIQRVDLNALEIAKALRRLMVDFGFNQEDLSKHVGKKRSTIANYLRLLSLPPHIQEAVAKDRISMGHAKAILALDGADKQNILYELILRDDLNVREAETAATRIGEKAKKNMLKYESRDFYLEQLAEKMQQKLGTKVNIQGKGKKGRISIDYYNLDDLDRILHFLGIQE